MDTVGLDAEMIQKYVKYQQAVYGSGRLDSQPTSLHATEEMEKYPEVSENDDPCGLHP